MGGLLSKEAENFQFHAKLFTNLGELYLYDLPLSFFRTFYNLYTDRLKMELSFLILSILRYWAFALFEQVTIWVFHIII